VTGISASDLAGIQAAVTDLLPDTALIQRQSVTSDGMGGKTGTGFSTVATVPCLVSTAATWRPSSSPASASRAGRRG
jgi:hypothetical protein